MFYKTVLVSKYRRYGLRAGHQSLEEQIKYSYEAQQQYEWTKKYTIIEIYLQDKLVFKSVIL